MNHKNQKMVFRTLHKMKKLAQSYTTESNPGSEGEVDGDGSDSTTDTEKPPSDDDVTEEPDLDIDSDMQVTPEESKPEIIFRLKGI
ncbi:MAG: hypothetical protein U0Z74_00315 [Romboutsia timonensis]